MHMPRHTTVLVLMLASFVQAQTVTFDVRPGDGLGSPVIIQPGDGVAIEMTAVVSTDGNDGLNLFVCDLLTRFPITSNLGAWYGDTTLFAVGLASAIAVYGFLAARYGSLTR